MFLHLPVVLTNTFYRQWGLVGVVIGTLAILIPFLVWFWKLDTSSTLAARLSIMDGLAGMFQKTVLAEAEKVIALIDEYLPIALSQADATLAQPSAFDNFCQKIRDLEKGEFDRALVKSSLTESLAGVIVKEVSRQITQVEIELNRTGFEPQTQQILFFLAEKSVQAKKKENKFHLGRRWVPRLWVCAVIFLALFIPSTFFNTVWAFYLGAASLMLFVGAFVIGGYAFLIFHNGKDWLEQQAARCTTPKDWFAEFSRTN